MAVLVAALAGYVAGSVPSGFWVVRVARGIDIRTLGSGNTGASNVWRTFGRRYGLPVALLDIGKGFAPALVATLLAGHLAGVVAGAAAMLGHWRPVFLGFRRGGKMVATCGGAFLGVAPIVGGLGAAVWILVFALSRYASLASILASLSLPAIAVGVGEPWPVVAFAGVAALAVVVLHRANVGRLLRRTERRFEFRRRHSEAAARS